MGLLNRLQRRRSHSTAGGVQVFTYCRVYPGVARQEVWDAIRPAEAALFLDDRCVRAWSEQGATGEIQSFVRLVDGTEMTSRIEILEESPPVFVRLRAVDAEMPTQMTFALDELESGVRLRHSHGYELPDGLRIVDERPMKEHSEAIFENLHRELERRTR